MTISSDEDDELTESSESEDEKDDQSMPAPISGGKKKKKKLTREQVREAVAKGMGVSLEKMDQMLGSTHKPKGVGEEDTKAEKLELVLEKEGEEGQAPELQQLKDQETSDAEKAKHTKNSKPSTSEAADKSKVIDDPESITFPIEPEAIEERKALSLEIKDKATKAYGGSKYKCAIKLYDFAHKLDPNNMVFKNNIAAVNLTVKNFQACIAAAEEAVKIGEREEADVSMLGKAYSRMGKAFTAVHKYDEAINAHKKSLEVDRNAQYLKLKNDCIKAKQAFVKASMYNPLKAQGCKARGNDFYKNNKFPEAVAEYKGAIEHDPDNVTLVSRVLCNRAACYTKMMEMVLAMEDCNLAIELDPKFLKPYLRKGAVLSKTEQWQEASKVYVQALEIDPHSFDARTGKEKADRGMNVVSDTAENRANKAMQDPKIREMWEDCRQLLQDLQEDPESRAVQKELEDPETQYKLSKLKEVGLLG